MSGISSWRHEKPPATREPREPKAGRGGAGLGAGPAPLKPGRLELRVGRRCVDGGGVGGEVLVEEGLGDVLAEELDEALPRGRGRVGGGGGGEGVNHGHGLREDKGRRGDEEALARRRTESGAVFVG